MNPKLIGYETNSTQNVSRIENLDTQLTEHRFQIKDHFVFWGKSICVA